MDESENKRRGRVIVLFLRNFIYWLTSFLCFICAIRAKIFMLPAIRLSIRKNQNSGIRKKGSCNIPCESTSDPIVLNATMQTAAPTNRRMPSQDETRIILFIYFLCSFSIIDIYKDKALSFSRTCKNCQNHDFSITICSFSFCKELPNGCLTCVWAG